MRNRLKRPPKQAQAGLYWFGSVGATVRAGSKPLRLAGQVAIACAKSDRVRSLTAAS